jgi:hypothetical protein
MSARSERGGHMQQSRCALMASAVLALQCMGAGSARTVRQNTRASMASAEAICPTLS